MKNGAEVFYHFEKTHKCKVAYVLHYLSSGLLHLIPTPASYLALGKRVCTLQLPDEQRAVKIARSLACNDVVFHRMDLPPVISRIII